jgi:recombination protein RecA
MAATAVKSKAQTAKEVMDAINQEFGAGTMRMASHEDYEVKMLPTGLAPFDDIFDGGIPLGRHIMLHGDFSTLKSYVGLCAIASAQRNGLIAALIDTEGTFDKSWARKLGVDLNNLVMPNPERMPTGEEAIDMAESLIHGGVGLIVVDSVAALLPQAEQQKKLGDAKQLGRQAEMMSKALRKLTARMNNRCAMLWINQTRVNPNVMFGSAESIPGGKTLPFYCSYIIGVYKAGNAKEPIDIYVTEDGKPVKKKINQIVGVQFRIDLKKSKLNRPNRQETFVYDLRTGGIDDWAYYANKCLGLGLLGYEKGRWWSPEDGKKLTTNDFRGHVPLDELKKLLKGTVPGVDSAGIAPRAKRKAAAPKRPSSDTTGRKPTRTPAREKSPSTARTTTTSSKSRTPARRSSSTTATSSGSGRRLLRAGSKAG